MAEAVRVRFPTIVYPFDMEESGRNASVEPMSAATERAVAAACGGDWLVFQTSNFQRSVR